MISAVDGTSVVYQVEGRSMILFNRGKKRSVVAGRWKKGQCDISSERKEWDM